MPGQPKLLPPALRPHKRYIAYEIISEQPVQYKEFVSTVWSTALSLLGEMGSSEAKVWFIHNLYDQQTQRGLLKCTHDSVEKIRAVLSLVTVVSESKSVIKILGVTGTIKSAKSKYLSVKDLRDFVKEK
jgi:ribonuclease P/MRP protein subunit POP5